MFPTLKCYHFFSKPTKKHIVHKVVEVHLLNKIAIYSQQIATDQII